MVEGKKWKGRRRISYEKQIMKVQSANTFLRCKDLSMRETSGETLSTSFKKLKNTHTHTQNPIWYSNSYVLLFRNRFPLTPVVMIKTYNFRNEAKNI